MEPNNDEPCDGCGSRRYLLWDGLCSECMAKRIKALVKENTQLRASWPRVVVWPSGMLYAKNNKFYIWMRSGPDRGPFDTEQEANNEMAGMKPGGAPRLSAAEEDEAEGLYQQLLSEPAWKETRDDTP